MNKIGNIKKYSDISEGSKEAFEKLAKELSCSGFVFSDIERVVDIEGKEIMSLDYFDKNYKPTKKEYKLITDKGLFITFSSVGDSLVMQGFRNDYSLNLLSAEEKGISKYKIEIDDSADTIVCKYKLIPIFEGEENLQFSNGFIKDVKGSKLDNAPNFYRSVVSRIESTILEYDRLLITKKSYEDLLKKFTNLSSNYNKKQRKVITNVVTKYATSEYNHVLNTELLLTLMYFDFSKTFKTEEDLRKLVILFCYLQSKNVAIYNIDYSKHIEDIVKDFSFNGSDIFSWLYSISSVMTIEKDFSVMNKLATSVNKLMNKVDINRLKTEVFKNCQGHKKLDLKQMNDGLMLIKNALVEEDKEQYADVFIKLMLNIKKQEQIGYTQSFDKFVELLEKYPKDLRNLSQEEVLINLDLKNYNLHLFKEAVLEKFNKTKSILILNVLDEEPLLALELLTNEKTNVTKEEKQEVEKILIRGE